MQATESTPPTTRRRMAVAAVLLALLLLLMAVARVGHGSLAQGPGPADAVRIDDDVYGNRPCMRPVSEDASDDDPYPWAVVSFAIVE